MTFDGSSDHSTTWGLLPIFARNEHETSDHHRFHHCSTLDIRLILASFRTWMTGTVEVVKNGWGCYISFVPYPHLLKYKEVFKTRQTIPFRRPSAVRAYIVLGGFRNGMRCMPLETERIRETHSTVCRNGEREKFVVQVAHSGSRAYKGA